MRNIDVPETVLIAVRQALRDGTAPSAIERNPARAMSRAVVGQRGDERLLFLYEAAQRDPHGHGLPIRRAVRPAVDPRPAGPGEEGEVEPGV